MFIENVLEKLSTIPIPIAPILLYITFFFIIYIVCSASQSKGGSYYPTDKNRLPLYKGKKGEIEIAERLNNLKRKYIVINDVMLESNNRTSQIDHIVVSPYGIFVIETKNYGGSLCGAEYDNYIAHNYGEKTFMIYNPMKQNRAHVYTLMRALGIEDKSIFIPILTVSDRCELNIEAKTNVVPFSLICSAIRQYNQRILSDEDVREIAEKIQEMNIVSEQERMDHIERVKLMNECPF